MNAVKILFIAFFFPLCCVTAFSQTKDDGTFVSDPIKSVHIYPNPTSEFLNVKFESPIARKSVFKIHNIIGNEMNVEVEVVDDFEVRLRVKEMHEGYYILAVQNSQSGTKATHKFLKL
ncbi:MAG: T9SS type A sorting domain-containing protein [Cytophagales bacterium]